MNRFLLCLLLCCAGVSQAAVDASRYRAFWLWASVRPQPVLHQASDLYLHQGELRHLRGKPYFEHQGVTASKLRIPAALWLSVRVSNLDIPDDALDVLLVLRRRWLDAGNKTVDIQIDFDAASYQLGRYGEFLSRLRRKLPPECRLSVTGLLDWAKTGDVEKINQLPIDELVIQTYQGRNTVENYQDYLPPLFKLKVPFRLGLVQHGQWDDIWQSRFARSPYYRGEVIFLLNPPRVHGAASENGK